MPLANRLEEQMNKVIARGEISVKITTPCSLLGPSLLPLILTSPVKKAVNSLLTVATNVTEPRVVGTK